MNESPSIIMKKNFTYGTLPNKEFHDQGLFGMVVAQLVLYLWDDASG
jgi:hypothetical protein